MSSTGSLIVAAGAEWSRILLNDADSTDDPNTLVVGSITETAGDAGTTSVTIDADNGSAYINPDDCAAWLFNTTLDWRNTFNCDFVLEIVTMPDSDSKVHCLVGITSNAADMNGRSVAGGFHRNLTTQAKRIWRPTTVESSSGNAEHAHYYIHIASPADLISSTVYSKPLKTDFSASTLAPNIEDYDVNVAPEAGADPVKIYFALGCTGVAAADYTIVFRLWRVPLVDNSNLT